MSKTKEETVQQWREALKESARTAVEALSAVTPIEEDVEAPTTDEASEIIGHAILKIRELVRPEPKTVAFLEEEAWYRMMDGAKARAYFTPKSALDFVMGNPPFNIPPAAEPIQPGAPQMVPGEDRRMSKPEAAYILAKLATSRRVNTGGVIALQMGVRAILKRHFDRQRNWAKRREAKAASVPKVPNVPAVPAAPHPAPLTPEEELVATITRQKEADAL